MTLCWLSAAVLSGILLAKRVPIAFPAWWLLCLLPIGIFLRRRVFVGIILLLAAGLLVGLQRGGEMRTALSGYQPLYGQQVRLVGRIHDDPAYDDKRRLDFRVDRVEINGVRLPGQVRVRALSAPGAQRGDIISTTGKLFSGFGNYQGTLSFAPVQVVQKSHNPVEVFRRRFFTGVYNALPDPQASLGLGFLVGLRAQLPDDLQTQLQALALTHIVVASGYNLTVLIRLSRRLLARYSKFQAFAGSLALMSLMLVITGMSPSMTRAAVVTSLALVTWFVGRTIHPILLLLMSAALTAWWNPLYMWSDLGWWLSFLAFAGVLVVAPLLTRRCFGQRSPPLIAQIGIETLAAQIVVEPLIVLVFGQFSVLGLVANIVVVPFIPLTMLGTLVAGLAGIFWTAFAGWAAWPSWVLLTYIVQMVQTLANVPWAVRKMTMSPAQLAVVYGGVVIMVILLRHRLRFHFHRAPNVVK